MKIAEGVSLDVPREGEGDPVILLPGFGTDVSAFSAQIPALRDVYEVVGVNLRGVGQSDPASGDSYEVETMAADVAALAGSPAHVVGTSMGTSVAIELALTHPEKVRSLTLLAPLVRMQPHLAAVTASWCRIAELGNPALLAESLLPWFFGPETLSDPKRSGQILRGLSSTLGRISAESLARFHAGLSAWSGSRESDLGKIAVPTLVIAGGEDLLTPGGGAIAKAIPGARLIEIPGAGHALGLEAADIVNRQILAHLAA